MDNDRSFSASEGTINVAAGLRQWSLPLPTSYRFFVLVSFSSMWPPAVQSIFDPRLPSCCLESGLKECSVKSFTSMHLVAIIHHTKYHVSNRTRSRHNCRVDLTRTCKISGRLVSVALAGAPTFRTGDNRQGCLANNSQELNLKLVSMH
jgi:hypothetical protein